MIDSPSAFRTLLHTDSDIGGWKPVTNGESGAGVFRSEDGSRYAKCVPAEDSALLEAERDRVDWLAAHPEELLARLAPQIEQRLAQEAAQTVVFHGDLCLPNIVLDPESLTVAGFIDLGRLGRADPYADIALLLASARLEKWTDDQQAETAEKVFADRYGMTVDRDRERFYLHLDPLTWD